MAKMDKKLESVEGVNRAEETVTNKQRSWRVGSAVKSACCSSEEKIRSNSSQLQLQGFGLSLQASAGTSIDTHTCTLS